MDREAIPREDLIEEIRAFMRRVGVEHAIFYGSRERGDHRPHSDLNLVLIDERFEGQPYAQLLQELHRAWKSDVYLELLPCSPVEFEEMKEWNPLAREASEHGMRIDLEPGELAT